MLDLIDLTDWKTKATILKELSAIGITIDERKIRQLVEDNNQLFCNEEVDYYIVHSSKGYKRTNSKEEITASINDYRKRALNMLGKYSNAKKALRERDNHKLDIR